MVYGNLHRRIARDEVGTYGISLDSRSHDNAIRIPDNDIVLDYVVIVTGRDKPYAEVVALACVSISTEPVPTEPVAARAAGQSYTAAGVAEIPISYGNIPNKLVVGSADHNNAGEAVGGQGRSRNGAA